jgi:hypothetical protein
MSELFLFWADYLKGKPIYRPIRRAIDLLFSIGLSSFFFEFFYGHYEWLNYNDYKGILDFFVKGNFFIPLSIFIVINGGIYFFSGLLFDLLNHVRVVKWMRKIIFYEVRGEDVDDSLTAIAAISKTAIPLDLSKDFLVNLYKELKKDIPKDFYENLVKNLTQSRENLKTNFHLYFKGLITITIYFLSLPQFGGVLYIFTLVGLLFTMYITLWAHRFLDVLPVLVRKFHTEAEKYIKNYYSDKTENIEQEKK